MSTETSFPTLPGDADPKPAGLGAEIRRMAERAAREERLAQERSNAAAAVDQSKNLVRAKEIRQKRVLGALLGAFVLFSAVNMLGFGVLSAPRPEPWTEESLDRYLREELQFQAEEIEFFVQEEGRLPYSLEEKMGSPAAGDIVYESLGRDGYRITITDSGKSLTYQANMD